MGASNPWAGDVRASGGRGFVWLCRGVAGRILGDYMRLVAGSGWAGRTQSGSELPHDWDGLCRCGLRRQAIFQIPTLCIRGLRGRTISEHIGCVAQFTSLPVASADEIFASLFFCERI